MSRPRGINKLPKELRRTIRRVLTSGWVLTPCGSGHFKLKRPGHPTVVMSASPSDINAWRNAMKDMRKAGVN